MLKELVIEKDPRLLVGMETSDDAGVFALTEQLALVQTADIITPVADDAYAFGEVAAANALSDVYAMGGSPLTALNLAFFPQDVVPVKVLQLILKGAADKVREAGAVVVGGHTVRDEEIKFGLSITGTCDPLRYFTNASAQPGDRLVLTKPIGTGLLIDAYRRGWLKEPDIGGALAEMARLNDTASQLAIECNAHAVTDVTGFGLAGHASEMAIGSGVTVQLWTTAVPRYDRVGELIERGGKTGLTGANRASLEGKLAVRAEVPELDAQLMCDPQTSGGLLVALPADAADDYVLEARAAGSQWATIVGAVEAVSSTAVVLASRS